MPGSAVTQEKLAAGEYALLQSGEFSWASLNFLDGRLVVEAAAAKPVPDIAAGKADGIFAKAAGTVIRTNLVSGTMLAVPGQAVEAGQLLIGTSRTERDGTPIYEPAAGAVFAQFDWESTQEEPLKITAKRLTGKHFSKQVISTNGQRISLPSWKPFSEETALVTTRHIQPDILGFGLPFSVEETTYSEQTEQEIPYTEGAGACACETAQFAGTFPRLSGRRVCGTERGHFRRKQYSLLPGRLYHRCQYLRRVNGGRERETLCRRFILF